MRPLRLEIQGFGAFRHRTELDFDDADFFALVGPTGAGKSTILDALCFALYGSVPRYDDEGLISPVITLGASEAKVRLDFELDGVRYIATRVAQRTPKGAKTKEARLERAVADGATEALASGAPEVTATVVRLLGLRFDDFTRCVALPQGEFARFLRGKVDERRELMLRLLNLGVYRKVGESARRLAETARSRIALLDGDLARYAGATAEALETATARRRDVDGLLADVQAAQPVLAALAADEQQARARARTARGCVERLGAIAVPPAVREFAERHRQAQARLAGEEEGLGTLTAQREAAQQVRAPLPDLGALKEAQRAHETLTGCDAEIAAGELLLEQHTGAEEAAAEAADRADGAVEQAMAARAALHREHQAAALTAVLAVGEPCPVCERVVDAIPAREAPPALAGAERAVAEAERARKDRQGEHRKASERKAATVEKLTGLRSRREALTGQVAAHPDRRALDELVTRVEAADRAVKELLAAEDEARTRAKKARSALEVLDEGARAARARFGAQRDTVADLEPPTADLLDVLRDWEALAAWAAVVIPTQQEAATGAEGDAAGLAARRAETLAALGARMERLGIAVAPGADPVALVAGASKAAADAGHAVARIEADMAQAAELAEARGRLDEEAGVADLLGKLLKADRFPEWLVAEALAVLTVDASAILGRLTGGQFSLAVGEKEFLVVDHANADERRPARSLSGGETFQASLALALALSEQIRNLAADGAPRLDAIFLDEGFGTLDPDTLDVVATTIETLGQSGRMVGVVTHVAELAARVPVRFEVSKGAGTAVVEKRVT